jgi:uncharacterized protein DUF955
VSARKHRKKWTSAAAKRLIEIAGGNLTVEEAIPKLAQNVLQGILCPPTDLKELCGRLGIVDVRAEDIPFSGELRPTSSGFEVIYGRHLSRPRQRFTIAHETAHALLERSGRWCPKTGRELELICDMWAAEVLMPREVLRSFWKADFSARALVELARTFEVSLSATALRCAELFKVSVFEATEREVTWGFGLVRKGPVDRIKDHDIRTAIDKGLCGEAGESLLYLEKQGVPHPHVISFQPLPRKDVRALLLIRKTEQRSQAFRSICGSSAPGA